MSSYQLYVKGVEVDLDTEANTALYPTYQVRDVAKPETIIDNDFSSNFSLPATVRNDSLLEHAVEDLDSGRVPYVQLPARLVCNGVDTLPRAILYVDGYENGRYQCQLAGGARPFLASLGEKTLQELDFSRFDHLRTLSGVADRMQASYYDANGWGYELYDRGQRVNLDSLDYGLALPTISAKLVWQQLLTEAGFAANDVPELLWERLQLPATTVAGYSEAYRKARMLLAGMERGTEIDSRATASRDEKAFPIPYQDLSYEGAPFTIPSAGNFTPGRLTAGVPYAATWRADKTCYVRVTARTVVDMKVADIGGKVSARVNLRINGTQVQQGPKVETKEDDFLAPGVTHERLLVRAGEELSAVLKMKNESGINKWGFRVFTSAIYFEGDTQVPRDIFQVEVLEEIPPGGPVRLADYLPNIKQVDYFKAMCLVMNLTVTQDLYEDRLTLRPGYTVLGNSVRAWDWTDKRDQPSDFAGRPRTLAYRFGSYGQRNTLAWKEDTLASTGKEEANEGYANGVLTVADANLPAEQSLGTLPFAATPDSEDYPGLLSITSWKRQGDALTPFDYTYTLQKPQPRLTLRGDIVQALTLSETIKQDGKPDVVNKRAVSTRLPYFTRVGDVELHLGRYVLPNYWRDVQAMLTDARFLKERYRLSVLDVERLRANFCVPIWDGVLRCYAYVNKIVEHDPATSTLCEIARLHPSFLPPPQPLADQGHEWYSGEFATVIGEFY
ncbi:hypothetical protein [Hymenobacter sp. GOD-10R]|uniref:hypothetical protein n=1 Tax=Hymenobacter sp. GOD-10R TaxID=3093922 RepID=UPI002D78D363|nr:hypothetical protein [Hymenobacter sp. GOD-10R]WRQ26680.1 hypothetical protein SD425_16530 [Hymenobacter sp. GOD-10R]